MLKKPTLKKPTVGASLDEWGYILNETIDTIDTFNSQIVSDSSTQDQELARLDRDKIDKSDLNGFVKNVVDNYIEENTKPQLNEHVETVNKPELDRYTETKKSELNNLTDANKEELVQYVDTVSKIEINSHTEKKKVEINSFTDEQKVELDEHEKVKEGQLEIFKDEKKVEITNHTDSEVERINATGIDGKQDKTDNTLETKDKTVVGAINELLNENINNLNLNKLGKTEKASDSELLDGHDSSYFATQSDMNSANTQIAQNKSDILLKANKTELETKFNFNNDVTNSALPKNYMGLTQVTSTSPSFMRGLTGGSQHYILQSSLKSENYGFQIGLNYYLSDIPRMMLRNFSPTTYSSLVEVYTTGNNTYWTDERTFWSKDANGRVIQGGEIKIENYVDGTPITFPITFSRSCTAVVTPSNNGQSTVIQCSPNLTQLRFYRVEKRPEQYIKWLAIGY